MNSETRNEKQTETAARAFEHTRSGQSYRPDVDIAETEDALLLYADMPGASADKIDINFENGTLTIHGTVEERQSEGVRFLSREYGIGDYYRSFDVSERIDPSKISAEYVNGVLQVVLPKSDAVKPRKIVVRSNS